VKGKQIKSKSKSWREKQDKKKRRKSTAEKPQTNEKESEPTNKLSVGKKALFGLVTVVLFFVVLELVLVLCGIQSVLTSEDPYLGFESKIPLFEEQTRTGGEVVLVTASNKMRYFNLQEFPKIKPPGAYRIFCLGGSTTFGRPYDDMTSFCGWLRELLPVADPSRKWELINAGGISYASYRITILMEELIQYEPDLFIVYSGHNEFLERRTYQDIFETPTVVTGIAATLSRLRTYSVIKRALNGFIGEQQDKPTGGQYMLPSEVDTILDNTVGPSAYTRDDEFKEQVVAHFRHNLQRMVDIARSAGAEIVLVTPASKLYNCSPFKSEHKAGLNDAHRERWKALYQKGQELEQAGKPAEALSVLADCEAIDDRYADSHFLKGSILYRLGRYEQAKAALQRACDEDICPVRALTSICEAVVNVAEEQDVTLVDFVGLIESSSEHAILGEKYFLDHVHPAIEGNRLLALALIDALNNHGIVDLAPSWNDQAIAEVARSVEQRIDRKAQSRALANLAQVLNWAGKFDEAHKLAQQAVELKEDNAGALYQVGLSMMIKGDVAGAIPYFRKALQIEPSFVLGHCKLGIALYRQGKIADAIKHYRIALRLKPNSHGVHNDLATALADLGKTDEAIKHYNQALRLKPNSPEVLNNLAKCLATQGKIDESIAQYTETLRINPDYIEAYLNLGSILAKQGRIDEAITIYKQAVQRDLGNASIHYNLANALVKQLKTDEAIVHYNEALRLNPNHVKAHHNLGNSLTDQGKIDDAITHYTEALRIKPDMIGVLERLAWIRATNVNTDLLNPTEAVRLAERANLLTRYQQPVMLDTLAAAYAAAGQFQQAVQSAEKALKLAEYYKEEQIASEIRSRLQLYLSGLPYREPSP